MSTMEVQQKKSKPSLLPEDLIVSCLAHVPRLYYPTLSLVSKSFRSLIASPELYRIRSLLRRTESCLYVCLQNSPDSNNRWFTLCRKPDRILMNENKEKESSGSGNLLVPIQIINNTSPPPVEWSNVVSVGCNLYAIPSNIEDTPTSNISFLDCRTHTWLEAPRMRLVRVGREIYRKMYLAGSSEKPESFKCIEVFDTKTQTWKKSEPPHIKKKGYRDLEGKIYNIINPMSGKPVTVSLKDATLEPVRVNGEKDSLCVIGKIIFNYQTFGGFGEFVWVNCEVSDNGEVIAGDLMGLEGLPKFGSCSSVRLANCGGKLMVLWDEDVLPESEDKEKMIWCAEISLENRNNEEEIWGKVEWFEAVRTVPEGYNFVCATAATL